MDDDLRPDADEEISPQHKYLRRVSKEAARVREAKATLEPKIEYRLVHDSRGRQKYRKLTRTPNGTHCELVPHDCVTDTIRQTAKVDR